MGMEEDRDGVKDSAVSPISSPSPSRPPLSPLMLLPLFRPEEEEEKEEEDSLFLSTSLLKAASQKSSDVTIEGSSKSGQGTGLGVKTSPSLCCIGDICVSSWL